MTNLNDTTSEREREREREREGERERERGKKIASPSVVGYSAR